MRAVNKKSLDIFAIARLDASCRDKPCSNELDFMFPSPSSSTLLYFWAEITPHMTCDGQASFRTMQKSPPI